MKKTFIFVCLSALVLSLAGCVKQTELSTDTLPVSERTSADRQTKINVFFMILCF